MSSNFNNGIGLNVANSSLPISPTNCVALSTSTNLWNIALFFGANIFAHAATIHQRTGATKFNSFQRMCLMLVAPITAGAVAMYAIVTFILGVKNCGIKWTLFLSSKEGLEDAVPAGGVGIMIPRELAHVVAGRWKVVGSERHSLLLDHEKIHSESREPHIPEPGTYLQFILPPQSRLPGYRNYKFYPSSSFANEFIAVVQLIYGIYQLVSQYGGSIQVMGLSSPYVFAIPYLFMSLVNLVANMLMPGFTHIAILPPKGPEPIHSNVEKPKRLVRRDLHCKKLYALEEYEWDDEYLVISSTLRKGTLPTNPVDKRERKRLMHEFHPKLSFITWKIDWWWWGKKPFRRSSAWSIETNPTAEQERELELWLEKHYPGVEASIRERPLRVYQYSRYIAVIVTLIVTTILLAVLTKFQFMVGVYAGRNISWIYIPPAVLLIPFIVLQARGKSLKFYHAVESLSSFVHNIIVAAYFGALIQLGIALYSVGDCNPLWSYLTLGTVWQIADRQTWPQTSTNQTSPSI